MLRHLYGIEYLPASHSPHDIEFHARVLTVAKKYGVSKLVEKVLANIGAIPNLSGASVIRAATIIAKTAPPEASNRQFLAQRLRELIDYDLNELDLDGLLAAYTLTTDKVKALQAEAARIEALRQSSEDDD